MNTTTLEPTTETQKLAVIMGDESKSSVEIDPDLDFIEEVARLGGETFMKCYQCATCSGTCPISPDDNPFPRKEIIWTKWGMKDQLLKDPDIWLCHQCNDCSAICPREGNPGDILAVIRQLCYKHYAFPRFMGTMLQEPKLLPVVLGIPIAILLAVLWGIGNLGIPEGEIIFKKFLPHPFPLDVLFVFAAVLAATASLIGMVRFWNGLKQGPRSPVFENNRGVIQGMIEAVRQIAVHSQFNECEKANPRYYSHLLTFYGFLGLFITTTAVFLGIYLFHLETPLSLLHPIKILGNVSAIAFLLGTGLLLYQRVTDETKSGISTYNDWLFIGLMFGLAVSGILSEVFRLLNISGIAYPVYFVHLVLILSMILYFPYSKFTHILYRTLAIAYYHGFAAATVQNAKETDNAKMETDEIGDEIQPNAA